MPEDDEPFGTFPIYVPRGTGPELSEVLPRSAIVGFPSEGDPSTIHVYYEGNRYGSPDLARFADRANRAVGRCRWYRLDIEQWRRDHGDMAPPVSEHGYVGYPTSAQARIPAASVAHVAMYDSFLGVVSLIGPEEGRLLTDWIGSSDPIELVATGRFFDRRREMHG